MNLNSMFFAPGTPDVTVVEFDKHSLSLRSIRLRENKFKCQSHRAECELCQQMFKAVKKGNKKINKKNKESRLISRELHRLEQSRRDR